MTSAYRVANPVEFFYLKLMERWERHAPPDGLSGERNGVRAINSQQARLAFVLNKVAFGASYAFGRMAALMMRRTGQSFLSRDPTALIEAEPLEQGWFLVGCMSLPQKQHAISQLRHLGLSAGMIRAAQSFVAGIGRVADHYPTIEETETMLAAADAKGPPFGFLPPELRETVVESITRLLEY